MRKITQSFTKDMIAYESGRQCGNIIKAKWVDNRLFPGSDDMALGSYFEYYLTLLLTGNGSLPKDGKVPVRQMYKDGSKPLAPYALAEENARRVIDYFKEMGIKIISAGDKATEGKFEGTIDLICEATKEIHFANGSTWSIGDRFVIDLKYSGLIADRWNEMGWGLMTQPGENFQKEYHRIQATHYHMLTMLPFYYLVVSSKNNVDILFLHVPIAENMVAEHIKMCENKDEYFEFVYSIGFEPMPSIEKCLECPLRAECTDKHTFPQPVIVEL